MNKCLELFLISSMLLSFVLIVSFTYFYFEISNLKDRLKTQKDKLDNQISKLLKFLELEEFEDRGFRKKVENEN